MSFTTATRTWAVSRVPVLRVARRGDRHHIRDLSVDLRVELVPEQADWPERGSLLGAVQALASEHAGAEPELYALALTRYCTQKLAGVVGAAADVRTRAWDRLAIGGRPRDRDLLGATAEERLARAEAGPHGERLAAGLSKLLLLSSYAAAEARITITHLHAVWTYGWTDVPFDTQWQQVRRALTEAYAERDEESGGALAAAMGRAVLEEAPAISEIRIGLETEDRAPVDMTAFGMENAGDVFGGSAQARTMHEVTLARSEIP